MQKNNARADDIRENTIKLLTKIILTTEIILTKYKQDNANKVRIR